MAGTPSFFKRHFLWVFYFIFLTIAFITHNREAYILGDGPMWQGKLVLWVIWLLFLIFSLRIHLRENFFKALKRMSPILWSKQIGVDLYLGLLVPLTLIYLHEGSLLMVALWFVPIFIFANLATFVYLALNFESLVAYFL